MIIPPACYTHPPRNVSLSVCLQSPNFEMTAVSSRHADADGIPLITLPQLKGTNCTTRCERD